MTRRCRLLLSRSPRAQPGHAVVEEIAAGQEHRMSDVRVAGQGSERVSGPTRICGLGHVIGAHPTVILGRTGTRQVRLTPPSSEGQLI
jgi:hypothetical protein